MPVIIRDPVYDYIAIDSEFILDVIDTPEFQRLRRIRQLGCSCFVYPGARHTRFLHSLGVMHLMQIAVNYLCDLQGEKHNDEDMEFALLAALLHDIGHTPFSHALEGALGVSHEDWTKQIITEEGALNTVLNARSKDYPTMLWEVFDKSWDGKGTQIPFLMDLISSQADVDRLDYLVRDSYFTGAKYGLVDVQRLIYTMKIVDGDICFEEKAETALEQYILARYYMYRGVYFHKATRAMELLLRNAIERSKELYNLKKICTEGLPGHLQKVISGESLNTAEFLELDDGEIMHLMKHFAKSDDTVLSDLAQRFIGRRHFCAIKELRDIAELPEILNSVEEAKNFLDSKGLFSKYYFLVDKALAVPYYYYIPPKPRKEQEEDVKPIIVTKKDGSQVELPQYSDLLRQISKTQAVVRFYGPEQFEDQLKRFFS